MDRAKILVDILGTVATINEYYCAALNMHKTPMQSVYDADNFGVRPGTKMRKMTPEEEEQMLKDMAEDDAAEKAERQAELEAWREADSSFQAETPITGCFLTTSA